MRLINAALQALLLGSTFLLTSHLIAKPAANVSATNINADVKTLEKRLEANQLNAKRQLISFEAEHCLGPENWESLQSYTI